MHTTIIYFLSKRNNTPWYAQKKQKHSKPGSSNGSKTCNLHGSKTCSLIGSKICNPFGFKTCSLAGWKTCNLHGSKPCSFSGLKTFSHVVTFFGYLLVQHMQLKVCTCRLFGTNVSKQKTPKNVDTFLPNWNGTSLFKWPNKAFKHMTTESPKPFHTQSNTLCFFTSLGNVWWQ